ncbi:MAG: cation diffusion facilitator family transporter [Flavobacteriales bacterium]|nr:cation diffusion facilitator family transporter [Flavobacteriales bacterium]MDW8431070.1 cation diffusion facilitator family transporter [Flavobacteriales bacterium]
MKKKGVITFQKSIFLLSVVLFALKLLGWLLTQSNALLSDALESTANIAAALFGFLSLRTAVKPKDEDHPYGHGKIEFVAATFEGTVITLSGIMILIKVVYNFFVPELPENLGVGMVISWLAGAVNGVAGFWALRVGQRSRSAVLKSAGLHLLSDAVSTAGVALGLSLAVLTHWLILDNLTALVFGLVLGVMGVRMVRRSIHDIMDRADPELLQRLARFLEENRKAEWVDIHNLRLIKYGSDIHIDAHVTVPFFYTLQQAHDVSEDLTRKMSEHLGPNTESFIHLDPCLPPLCQYCQMTECHGRSAPFKTKIKWTPALLQRNAKHHKAPTSGEIQGLHDE